MNQITLVSMCLIAGFLSACASTAEHRPTHQWVADNPVPRAVYMRDNNSCVTRSGYSGAAEAQSSAFKEYRNCMVTAGYRLESL